MLLQSVNYLKNDRRRLGAMLLLQHNVGNCYN